MKPLQSPVIRTCIDSLFSLSLSFIHSFYVCIKHYILLTCACNTHLLLFYPLFFSSSLSFSEPPIHLNEVQPQFIGPILNVTVAVGRDLQLPCTVSSLGSYKVRRRRRKRRKKYIRRQKERKRKKRETLRERPFG